MRLAFGRAMRAVVCLCLTAGLLGGCLWDQSDQAGVVAVVGGSPIRLAELEARHDLGRLGLPQVDNPAVEELRSEYGATLAGLIVARLVNQELDRLKLSLTDQERRAAEEAVRADYPGDAFEAMLLEEHIDLPRWREMLADRLALEKFTQNVLRPNVRVGVSEAANYYKEHIDAFTRPASVRLRLVVGRDAETVKAALAAARKADSAQADAGVHEVVLPEAGLPPAWREALKARKPGEATAPLASGHDFLGLILVERLPATVLDPAKAYPRVESRLAAEKLAKAFAAWLAEALAGATIRVNTRLLAGQPPGDSPAAPAAEKAEQAELDAARSQGQASDSLAKRVRMTLAEKQADAPIPDQKPVEPATESTPASTAPPPAVAEEVPAPLAPPVVEEPAVRTPPAPIGPAQPDPVAGVPPPPPAPAMAQQGHEAALRPLSPRRAGCFGRASP
ncbi:peptidylprolyl isomerase, partial [Desulfovibrio sp. DV]|uniref:peptidylprolyl isomerase n=1 Tax=Desulfovibrio sp. DV TaxID=1844708 RepID=UPI0020C97AAF